MITSSPRSQDPVGNPCAKFPLLLERLEMLVILFEHFSYQPYLHGFSLQTFYKPYVSSNQRSPQKLSTSMLQASISLQSGNGTPIEKPIFLPYDLQRLVYLVWLYLNVSPIDSHQAIVRMAQNMVYMKEVGACLHLYMYIVPVL